jgi:uncharacterized protein (TIGR00369 family)
MKKDLHFRSLEKMYLAAPVNSFYSPSIDIREDQTTIEVAISEQYFHAGGAVHGSVYFKLLDDAAFFAAAVFERTFFVVTNTFTTYLTRPVSSGVIRSVGRVVNKNNTQFIVESVAYDSESREIGRGTGIIARSKLMLEDVPAYSK